MIDTHCHLTDERLANQLDDVVARAAKANVTRIVTIGTHPADWQPCIDVCVAYPGVRCALGIHPNLCHLAEESDIGLLRGYLTNPTVVAVGEMGLDYHHGAAPRDRQARFFQGQLEAAAALSKSVVIHCREAVDDALAILKSFAATPAVFHCFTGTAAEARRIIDAGYLIGFTGVVTYKNAPELCQIARDLPADRMLVETDAPYLSPEPMRKLKVNEPAMVVHTAAAVAAARGVTVEEIDRITTENALRFYRWAK